VCKLLIELKVNFVNKTPIQQSQKSEPFKRPPYEPAPAYERPKPAYEPYVKEPYDFGSIRFDFEEFFKGRYNQEYYKRPPTEAKIPNEPEPTKEPKSEKRVLKCTTCGESFMTGYIGNLFICHNCSWKEYNERREKKGYKGV
jgi:hypothetical protein